MRAAATSRSGGWRRACFTPLAAALGALPVADRDALLLLAWAELSYEEIARVYGIPIGTVRSRINRARRRIHEHLDTE